QPRPLLGCEPGKRDGSADLLGAPPLRVPLDHLDCSGLPEDSEVIRQFWDRFAPFPLQQIRDKSLIHNLGAAHLALAQHVEDADAPWMVQDFKTELQLLVVRESQLWLSPLASRGRSLVRRHLPLLPSDWSRSTERWSLAQRTPVFGEG